MASPRRAQSASLANLLATTDFFPSTEEVGEVRSRPPARPAPSRPDAAGTSPQRGSASTNEVAAQTAGSRPLGQSASPQRCAHPPPTHRMISAPRSRCPMR